MMLVGLLNAIKGLIKWSRLDKKYKINQGLYVLLMPDGDCELNEIALCHIDDLLEYKKGTGVLILTCDDWVHGNAESYSRSIRDVIKIDQKTEDQLLALIELYRFTERLLIVSLSKPFGRDLSKLIGINNITKQDIVCLCIFVIRNWNKQGRLDG